MRSTMINSLPVARKRCVLMRPRDFLYHVDLNFAWLGRGTNYITSAFSVRLPTCVPPGIAAYHLASVWNIRYAANAY
jgi:hypothetical protein